MNLSEELDFNLEICGTGYLWEIAHKPRYTNPWKKAEAEEIKQQILNDYEKARKWEDFNEGKSVAFAIDINDNMVLSPRLQEQVRQNQKLRELIEKRILFLSMPEVNINQEVVEELHWLLKESKK